MKLQLLFFGLLLVYTTAIEAAPIISYRTATLIATRNVAITPDSILSTGDPVTLYSISPVTLATGLVFDTLTGIISGTATIQSLPANYTVTGTGPGGTATTGINISVYAIPTGGSCYSDEAPASVLGVPVSVSCPPVTGGISHFSVSPLLPSGIVLDSLNGCISGMPTGNQAYGKNYTITKTSSLGPTTNCIVNITVVGAPSNLSYLDDAPTYPMGVFITPPNIPNITGIVTQWWVSPAFPPGVALDGTTGYILGTPTIASPLAKYVITGTNPGGSTSATILLGTAPAQ